ncbi:hypothetical protein BD324DRAFT_435347 [Kockovaella imperatae]|uniref:GRAM domain-containing protein n=1 Tax=Kockovaella imperatae TaxID=4999 RepID=A0A1Y1UI82_9TREE|nr:hypothetical protein BD324DRAFT_435347 [Kockovaella imperatae]ORX37247.1 hypothetical protein BD324DRAFT_435347 [Kockovaella imperatae]
MSLNTLSITSMDRFDLLPGEHVLTPRHTADIELKVPATLSGPKRTETADGFLWVTDHRVVFAARTVVAAYDAPPQLESLVIPYTTLLKCTFNLPTFSANHLLISFLPDPELGAASNLPAPGRGSSLEVKIIVGDGAGHGVWKRIEGERQRHEHHRSQGEVLPAYSS